MIDPRRLLVSRPMRLHWAGWETSTLALQQAGWSLTAEQDLAGNWLQLALRYGSGQLYGLSERVRFDYLRAAGEVGWEHGMILPVRHMASRLEVVAPRMATTPAFRPIDAHPQFLQQDRRSLEDFAAFATPLARTQEIVIPEESVSDLLARILEKQDPARTEYFRRQLREERDARPRQRFHAQILSIAA